MRIFTKKLPHPDLVSLTKIRVHSLWHLLRFVYIFPLFGIHSCQKRRRHCWSQRSTRSRCQSPPSSFWPLTSQQLHCIRMRRSSWSSLRFLCSTFWPSSMATQRRCTVIYTQNQTNNVRMGNVFSIRNAKYHSVSCSLSGVQNLQGEFSQKVSADQTSSIPRFLH